MIWLAFPAFVILTVRLAIVVVNLLSQHYLREVEAEQHVKKGPPVSVLIPARNEEQNLSYLLDGLLEQEHAPLEILVYDDQSTDRTAEIVLGYAGEHPAIRLFRGGEVPAGWSGKNHACHRLAEEAAGDYFLFLDADVQAGPGLISRALSYVRERDLTLLSLFPRQQMKTPGELMTVPFMHWILLSLLPLPLVRKSYYPSLSAANGQCMLFRAREYRHHQFHSLVRDINVEDIHIIRRVKSMGYTAQVFLGRDEITCRMYRSFREAVFGFTRSTFAFFGGSGLTMLVFTLFSSLGVVFVWVGMSPFFGAVYLLLAGVLRAFVAVLGRQPVWKIVVLSPLIQLSFIWIVIHSFLLRARGRNTWKGRIIQFRGI